MGFHVVPPLQVYIQYMKFARRAEGIKSGRTIFKKAREDVRTRHHVYVTAALMEYYCSKVSVNGLVRDQGCHEPSIRYLSFQMFLSMI